MRFQYVLRAALFALPVLSIYVDHHDKRDTGNTPTPGNSSTLPACNAVAGPCTCPPGSFYVHSTTYAFYPAAARDVTAICGNFFDISWFGITVNRTEGPPNRPGSKRAAYELPPDGKDKLLTQEQLTNYTRSRDGGFYYSYNSINNPLKYEKTDGTIGAVEGSWEFIDVKEISPGWTSFIWNVHACLTDKWPLGPFHEHVMQNVTAILKQRKQLRGVTKGPISI